MALLKRTISSIQGAQVEDKGKASNEDLKAAEEAGEEMYIGFDKKDTEPRKGRKGRVVKGRPEDYPERTDFTGGWAGGEKGLQEFIKKYEVLSSASPLTSSTGPQIHWENGLKLPGDRVLVKGRSTLALHESRSREP